jgi:hypothetical protein
MLKSLLKLLGIGNKTDFRQLIQNGAVIIDVRSRGEFTSGHIKDAVNIPLDQLRSNTSRLKDKQQTIITCCASGMRSASAKSMLKSLGYEHVYNGGGWYSLQRKIM